MAKRIDWATRLARAEEYLYLARAVTLPAAGHARGAAVRHKQALLRAGRGYIGRLAHPRRTPPGATADEAARAVWLIGQLDAEQPVLLDELRRQAQTED